jgi:hypothetical protein
LFGNTPLNTTACEKNVKAQKIIHTATGNRRGIVEDFMLTEVCLATFNEFHVLLSIKCSGQTLCSLNRMEQGEEDHF